MTDPNSRIQSDTVRVALLFIDGVGVGRRDPAVNPLARGALPALPVRGCARDAPARGGACIPVDTTFGVPGRPQSASNQTAILTGDPAPALIGRHVLGYPNAALRELLAERSLVKRLVAAGRTRHVRQQLPGAVPGRAEAAPAPSRPRRRSSPSRERCSAQLRPSASTLAFAAGEVPLRTLDDARAGEGLTHDIAGAQRTRTRPLRPRSERPRRRRASSGGWPSGSGLHLLRALPGGRGGARAGLRGGATARWTPSTPSPGRWWRAAAGRASAHV